jgi:hypothetical protein
MSTTDTATRRHFFRFTGAALAAPLAISAAGAGDDAGGLAARLAALEDANAIRALQRDYARFVNARAHAELATLFTDPAAARADPAVSRISTDGLGGHEVIAIDAGGAAATARLHCLVETATPVDAEDTLVDMARLQGDGVVTRREHRVLESTYVKHGGVWKIERAAFRAV